MRRIAIILSVTFLAACSGKTSENSASCGFTAMAGATAALQQFGGGTKVLTEAPPELHGHVPVRVVGHGTVSAPVEQTSDGPRVEYSGEGFPPTPGFGLALVEDSADTFKGVLVYEVTPPVGYPQLGQVAGDGHTIPLYGARVTWGQVSTPRCPLFADIGSPEDP